MRIARPLLLLLLLGTVSLAGGSGPDTLFRALDLERAEGKIAEALDLYRQAAGSPEPGVRGRALLGEARCLRRLGKVAEALKILAGLIEDGAPPEVSAQARSDLARVRAALRAKAAPPPGGKSEDERERTHREELARYALDQARALYREARFDEARIWVKRALEQDPSNVSARDLWQRLGASLGERERIVQEVLGILERERRLRVRELQLEADALISAGEELLLQGNLGAAAARFSECLSLVLGHPAFRRDLAVRRETAADRLQRIRLRGGKVGETASPPRPAAPAREDEWRATLRKLLQDMPSMAGMGRNVLRIHDLAPLDDPTLGPAAVPGKLSLSARRPPPGPLLAPLLPLLFRPARGDDVPTVRSQDSELVVIAPPETQDAVATLLERLAAGQDPPLRLTLTVVAADSPVLSGLLSDAGAVFRPAGDGAFGLLEPRVAARLRHDLEEGGQGEVLGTLETLVPPGRAVSLERRKVLTLASPGGEGSSRSLASGLTVDLLPVRAADGFAVGLTARVTRIAKALSLPAAEGVRFTVPPVDRERVSLAARMSAGNVLAVAGLGNPFGSRSLPLRSALLLLLRVEGGEGSRRAAPPASAGAPAPGPAVAVDIGSILHAAPDHPAPPLRGTRSAPSESREGFLLRYLTEAVGAEALSKPNTSLTLARGVAWVRGDTALVTRVREAVEGLVATKDRTIRVRFRAAAVAAAEESAILRGLTPAGEVREGEGVRLFRVRGEALRRVGFFVSGAPGRVPLLDDRMVALSTQLAHVARITRLTYLRGYHTGESGDAWPVYDAADEGIAFEGRPVLAPGERVALWFALKVSRILVRRAGAGSEAASREPPVQALSVVRAHAVLAPGEALLVSGVPAPSPVTARRDRLLVLLDVEL